MINVYHKLLKPTEDANSGSIIGNIIFYSIDYMVSSSIAIGLIPTEFSGSTW